MSRGARARVITSSKENRSSPDLPPAKRRRRDCEQPRARFSSKGQEVSLNHRQADPHRLPVGRLQFTNGCETAEMTDGLDLTTRKAVGTHIFLHVDEFSASSGHAAGREHSSVEILPVGIQCAGHGTTFRESSRSRACVCHGCLSVSQGVGHVLASSCGPRGSARAN